MSSVCSQKNEHIRRDDYGAGKRGSCRATVPYAIILSLMDRDYALQPQSLIH
jgi:hypothetical protein